MPRPNPPPPAAKPTVLRFLLDDHQQRDLAKVLGLKKLSPLVSGAITDAIACLKASEAGTPDTTVGNTLAGLAELKKTGRAYDRAVRRLADDRSGVDYTTHSIVQPLARGVLVGEQGAREKLSQAADLRAAELREHPRIQTAKEPLRLFCGVLREIFNRAAAPELKPPLGDGWHHCRQFAMEVFAIAGIEHADFDAHPGRLTEYLGTDVGGIFDSPLAV
jgi:hypothetical protein